MIVCPNFPIQTKSQLSTGMSRLNELHDHLIISIAIIHDATLLKK